MSLDPREAIEQAARQHRDTEARASDASVLAAKERDARRKMLEESLWEASGGSPLLLIVLMVMLTASLGLCFLVIPAYTQEAWLAPVAAAAALAGSMLAVVRVGSWALTAWHTRAVRGIGHGFDAEAYLDLMSRKRRRGALVATLRFDAAWDEDLRGSTADAVRAWCRDIEGARWEGERALRLETAPIATVRSYRKNRSYVTAFTNYPLHACMKCVVKRVLPRLDAVHRVTHIEVRIAGDECAFDATP